MGAHRANVTKVILPWANRKDVEHDVPLEVRSAMQFAFVRTVEEALEAAFGPGGSVQTSWTCVNPYYNP